ncbi:PilZ domain-containing protein [Hyphococcus sp.]|uniref:PilZ domain-containing protein n=1 Tax=Hyphococcus sp. TaxID=2038636 RepID=UPI003CCBDAC8
MKKKQKEHIANRLASISSTTSDVKDVRIPVLKGRERPERAERSQVFRPGKLYLSKSNFARCVIRDISETGANVHIEGTHPLPKIVVLRFEQSGIVKKARVVWQDDVEAGLQFIVPSAGADETPK